MTRLKSTLLALVLLTAAPAFAQTDVNGDWDVTITSPQGPSTTLVTFKQDGEKISGIFKSDQGQLPFEGGTLTGSDLKFTFTITTQGMQLPITLTGKVDGAAMTGKADFGGFAEGDWTAKRSATTTASSSATTTTTTTTSTTTTTTTASTGVGFGGKWDVMLKTPGGDFPANATLKDDNGKVSGTFGSQMGEVPITGSVEGKALKLTMVAQTPQGDMTVILTGDLDGDSIVNGKADVSGMGMMEWSAKRIKQ
jgi:hypothetical protein